MNDAARQEKQLFEELIDIADAAGRAAFLDRRCPDPSLRRRLEELLALQEQAETLLGTPPTLSADEFESYAGAGAERPGSLIGRYKLIRRMGSGGCGVVYLAEQQEPVKRQVALKIIRLGMDTEHVIARFELERQALAIMDHPNIARVLDAGATEAGRPYFVMELVQGIKITDYCAQHRLSTDQRLGLFILVCHALQHAHQKGIIHRDIKPSNILVETHDGQPVPKVIDFGIAKAIEETQGGRSGLTIQLLFIGTPAYMSPEQTSLGNPDLDTRSDIYSLGVLLHELLVGRPPFDPKELESAGLEGMRRILCEREALRPSKTLASLAPGELLTIADQHRTEPARLISAVEGDLDWIVATALEKDRRRRYETAYGMAMDLRRHLANELVSARPPSRLYRFGKLVRRNRVAFLAGTLVLLSLLAGLGTSTWLLLREREARREQARLLVLAEAGEKIARAAVYLTYNKRVEADALVASVPVPLLRPSLECAQVLRDLGEWHALSGRWPEAARCYFGLAQVIIRVDDSDSDKVSFNLMPAGTAISEHGDLKAYDAFRRDILARFQSSRNPMPAEQVIKACLLAPAPPEILAALVPLVGTVEASVDASIPPTSDNPYLGAWRCFALALFELRRDRPDVALNWCDRSERFANINAAREISVNLVRAMAVARLGDKDGAQRLVAENQARVEQRFLFPVEGWEPANNILWFDWINARLLLREAIVATR